MTILAFAPSKNKPGKKDATGAFIPKALEFLKLHGDPGGRLKTFDPSQPLRKRRSEILEHVIGHTDVTTYAFFCHGWKDGMQAGYLMQHAESLAALMVSRARQGKLERVILYACDSGRDGDDDRDDDLIPGPGGNGGFADALRDALTKFGGADVYAHTTAGHSTNNPYVRVFKAGDSLGGQYLVNPGSPLWGRWKRALRETDLWARFPFMRQENVLAELEEWS